VDYGDVCGPEHDSGGAGEQGGEGDVGLGGICDLRFAICDWRAKGRMGVWRKGEMGSFCGFGRTSNIEERSGEGDGEEKKVCEVGVGTDFL
jgi:hypothetical protein